MSANVVYLLVTISAFFWGVNFVLAEPVLADLSPLWAAALRFLLGAFLMLAIAWQQGVDLRDLARRHVRIYFLLGLVGIVGFNFFFFHAMQSTSADNGALIMATNPLITTLLASVMLGERASFRHLAALPVVLAGVIVVITHGDMARLLSLQVAEGDLLMIGANLTWALFNVLSRRHMPKGSSLGHTALMMTAGAILLLIMALLDNTHLAMPSVDAGLALAVMVVGGTVLAYLFWGMGIQHLGAGRTALFLNLVPVFTMLVEGVLGTPPTLVQMSGGLLVLSGVAIAMLPGQQNTNT